MGWIGCVRCEKSRPDFVARTFALIAPVHPYFASSFMQLRNDSKCIQTLCDASKHESRVQWGGSGVLVAKNYNAISWYKLLLNCTSSICFATRFMQLRNDPKCTQTLRNTPKHEITIQWGGSGAFVVKNYNVTS